MGADGYFTNDAKRERNTSILPLPNLSRVFST